MMEAVFTPRAQWHLPFRLHDAAFDRCLITFNEDRRLVLSKRLKGHLPQSALWENCVIYEGDRLQVPVQTLEPRFEFIAYHR